MRRTMVKKYRGTPRQVRRHIAHDAEKLSKKGYQIVGETTLPGKRGGPRGLLGFLTIGLWFLFSRPKDTVLVTYALP